MTCTMDIPDGSGHISLQWDPDDPESLAKAREEFARLKAAGYAFFASKEEDAEEVAGWPAQRKGSKAKRPAWEASGALDVRPDEEIEQVTEFQPRARRQVAMRPMRGG